MLEACHRTSRASNSEVVTDGHFEQTQILEGLDGLGLDDIEQRYIQILGEADGPLALNMLATRLSMPRKTVSTVIESFLIRQGLVTKINSLRKLTAKGIKHLRNDGQGEVTDDS